MTEHPNLAAYYFHQGTSNCAYEYLGVHREMASDGTFLYTFRVWAPNAKAVGLISDFTGWETARPMEKNVADGVFELTVSSAVSLEKQAYKYRVVSARGTTTDKGDPYAAFSRGGGDGASLVFTYSGFSFTDDAWLSHRRETVASNDGDYLPTPLNIYEIHAASFMRHPEDNRYLSYRELADVLVPYLKTMGYTHAEFLPLAEYPYDGSWGYQVCGFYAPTSRFGDPDDFRYLINALHTAGIGVIMDWVPAHFPKDAWGLYEFDGQPLYEYQGKDRQESPSWGTRFFDLGRPQVQSFLISNAVYWFREFHIDGLRVDAVASMLYLDYDREPGKWIPNIYGGRENLEAVAFLKKLNQTVFAQFPDVLMIAEESTAFPGVTHPVCEGGLGFNLKWNMGYANDMYEYVSMDPVYRSYHHKALTFPLMYAFSENFVLPISHDEVVHGKKSLIDKMFGSYEDKFSEMRTMLLMMMTYPGKKMLFMGTEFAQFREWDYENSLEWFMLDYPMHRKMRDFVASLNRFYLSRPELWEIDFREAGFSWLLPDENEKNAVAFLRRDKRGNTLFVALTFSGAPQTLRVTFPQIRGLTRLFSTADGIRAVKVRRQKDKHHTSYDITLPAFSGAVYSVNDVVKTIEI